MNTTHSTEYRRGLYCVIGCYLIWGFFPLYWLPLVGQPISAGQLMAHRIVWASLLAIGTVACSPSARTQLAQAVKSRQTLTAFAICSTLLATNWLLYLAAITQRQVLQASLGYFIAPLASIFCGRLFLREALRPLQIGAILLAIIGVVWLSAWGGQMPWIALGLGVSWSIYGLLRKLAPLPALPGFTLETLMLLPFALLYLGWHYRHGSLVFTQLPPLPLAIVIGSGAATMIPLLLFAAAAQRIRLTTIGILQYLSPSLQFLLGLIAFHEPFSRMQFAGYLWVWAGVALFVWAARKKQAT